MAPSKSEPSSSEEPFWLILGDPLAVRKPKAARVFSMLSIRHQSDCDVFCGNEKWEAHKHILSRCAYFKRAFAHESNFKEARESQIRIEEFEPFEIEWLLECIYIQQVNADYSRRKSPTGSSLECCILLWSIGDYFHMEQMCESALKQLKSRCKYWLLRSRCLSTMLKDIDFLPDLDDGIRAAWRHDTAASPGRNDLISLCIAIRPFVKDHPSFIRLLDEIPDFTAHYVKALLGCPGLQSIESRTLLGTKCDICNKLIFNGKGVQVTNEEAFIWTPTSIDFWNNCTYWCCSQKCCNSAVHKFVLPGPTEKSSKSSGKS